MSDTNDVPESRIQLLNGNGTRKPKDRPADWATKADAEAIAVKVAEFYNAQIPAYVRETIAQMVPQMITGALVAYGLVEIKKPGTTPEATVEPTSIVEDHAP